MADLRFEIDIEKVADAFGEVKQQLQKDLKEGVEGLATMTHSKTLELARDELGSLSKKYMDNVEFANPIDGLWVVTLKEPVLWIEEGRKGGFMEELLSGKSSKTSKDGKKYAVIPFEHSKNPSEQSPAAQKLANEIKDVMKKKGINWKKIEYGQDGSPKVGRLHSFNVNSAKVDPKHKYPATYGVSVYQSKDTKGNVRRNVMTFRVITEDHRNDGRWIHPGRDGNKLMDKAFEWAQKTFYDEILPTILEKYK